MSQGIARVIESLLRLLPPGSGRRRSPEPSPAHLDTVTARLPHVPTLRGEDIGLVRPYLVAHERRQEERNQRVRRRTLWLAVHSDASGLRLIRTGEVSA